MTGPAVETCGLTKVFECGRRTIAQGRIVALDTPAGDSRRAASPSSPRTRSLRAPAFDFWAIG